tara:strand:- start:122 stop:466 length:345 start_codon:yes stop_codon:yes gene_type:complete
MVILSLKLTVFTQTISNDSLKCFTIKQSKQIIKDLKKGQVCDSITHIQALQLFNFKTILRNKGEEVGIKNKQILSKTKEVNTLNLKLKVSKSLTKYGIPAAFFGGFLVGILVKN